MPGRHRGVGREDAHVVHRREVLADDFTPPVASRLVAQELEDQQGRVALVHVVAVELIVAQRLQHTHTADTEQNFLGKAVTIVPPIQVIRQGPILIRVFREIRVQEKHGHHMSGHACHIEPPSAQHDLAVGDLHFAPCRSFDQEVRRVPVHRFGALLSLLVQALGEIALVVEQRDRGHRHSEVRRGCDRVARQHAEAAAVRGHLGLQGDLHGEIGDLRFGHDASRGYGSMIVQ